MIFHGRGVGGGGGVARRHCCNSGDSGGRGLVAMATLTLKKYRQFVAH